MMKRFGNGLTGHRAAATKVAAFFCVFGSNLFALPVQAAAELTVNPVVIKLPAKALATSLKLQNEGRSDVSMQAEVFEWSQPQGEDVLTPTREVVVSPPVFRIVPGATQVVRIGRLKAQLPGARELSYRVVLSEYQPSGQQAEGNITTLLKLSLPIYVPPLKKQPAALQWQAERVAATDDLKLKVSNPTNSSVRITALNLLQDGAVIASRKLVYPVLPGATRSVTWPKALLNAKPGVALELKTELGRAGFLLQPLDTRVISVVPL